MNKSYSKIRHIQEANLWLEERLLNERFNNQQMISEQTTQKGTFIINSDITYAFNFKITL